MKCNADKDIKDCCQQTECCDSCNYEDCHEGCVVYMGNANGCNGCAWQERGPR